MNTSIQPSSERPLRFHRRHDLQVYSVNYDGIEYPILKDPLRLKYYRLTPEQFAVLEKLDGKNSLVEILASVQEKFPTLNVELSDVRHLIVELCSKGVATARRRHRGPALVNAKHEEREKFILQAIKSPFFLKLTGWNPQFILRIVFPLLNIMFHRRVVPIAIAFVIFSWLFAASKFEIILQRLPEFSQFFGWPNLLWLWLTIGVTKTIHELGHAVCCQHFDRACHSVGIMLMFFSPTMYCDVSDSWTLRNKWSRIAIAAGGMYFEVLLSAICVHIWWYTAPGTINFVALNVFFISTFTTVVFNANPLLRRFDGYYMLSDLLEIPNLRSNASDAMKELLGRLCLGEVPPRHQSLTARRTLVFLVYSVAATVYRCLIFVMISTFLYTLLKPFRMEALGICFAIYYLTRRSWGILKSMRKRIEKSWAQKNRRRRIVTTGVFAAVCLISFFCIPIPFIKHLPIFVEPADLVPVYAPVSGELVRIEATVGQKVQKGDLIIELHDRKLDEHVASLVDRLKSLETERRVRHGRGDKDGELLAKLRILSIQQQLDESRQRKEKFTVTSPATGIIVPTEEVSQVLSGEETRRLEQWSGSPLEHGNIGAYLLLRTHICSIAPNSDSLARMYIEPAVYDFVRSGARLEIVLDHCPWERWSGTIKSISADPQSVVPHSLSNKFGGPLPTVTVEGGERLSQVAYLAYIEFSAAPEFCQTAAVKGTARIRVTHLSLGDITVRWIRRTLRFPM